MSFPLGKLLATPGSLRHLADHGVPVEQIVARHLSLDFGDLCDEDKRLNLDALRSGERILSAYAVAGVRIYVITEWDRSYTTVLLSSEY